MNNQTVYWIWIQQALGYGAKSVKALVNKYTFAEEFYRAPLADKLEVCRVRDEHKKKLSDDSLYGAYEIIKRCIESGIEIVTFGDDRYPEALRSIDDPPAVLYVKGDISALGREKNVAVVGTRHTSPRGRQTADRLAYELAKAGICVISGGAVGIDSQAHGGVLRANGTTVCVLGCGHESGYLKELESLRRSIAVRGAVISEYPPDHKADRRTFPCRNRIISGMSRGVVVVESGLKGGSLITANCAQKQKRVVMAVPENGADENSSGTNMLIRGGAVSVLSAKDIIKALGFDASAAEEKKTPAVLPDNAVAPVKDENMQLPDSILDHDFSSYINERIKAIAEADRMRIERQKREDGSSAPDTLPLDIYFGRSDEKEELYGGDAASERTVRLTERGAENPENGTKRNADEKEKPPARSFDKMTESAADEQDKAKLPEDLSENALAFLNALGSDTLHIDTIAERTDLPISAVHAAATELEMEDLIEMLDGRRCMRTGL